MKNKEYESILKMIKYIDKTLQYNKNYDFTKFCDDEKNQDASIFNICQIGELIKNISEETINKYNKIEWKMIKGLRNRIIHDYDGINLENIWYILEEDLPSLKSDLEEIISDYNN